MKNIFGILITYSPMVILIFLSEIFEMLSLPPLPLLIVFGGGIGLMFFFAYGRMDGNFLDRYLASTFTQPILGEKARSSLNLIGGVILAVLVLLFYIAIGLITILFYNGPPPQI